MVESIGHMVQEHPEVLVFLSLAMGYLIAKVKIKGFGIGTTASVLLVAMVLGQFRVDVSPVLKSISFAIFAFCIGYQVGPQFFGTLRSGGLKYLWISIVVSLAGLCSAVVLGKILHFDEGTTAGLFAGAMTQSAAIGTAEGAVDQLALSPAQKQILHSNITLAYAITYLFGVVGVVVLFKCLPGLFRWDLRGEARKLEEAMGGGSELQNPDLFSWSRQVGLRAYVAKAPGIVGSTVAAIEGLFPTRIAICHLEHAGRLRDTSPEMRVETGDILVLAGKQEGLVLASDIVGQESDVATVIDMMGESLDIYVLNPAVMGKTLGQIGRLQDAHGLFLTKMTRQGRELPLLVNTVVNKGDITHLVGRKEDVERAARSLGYAQRYSVVTDMVMLGLGCFLGLLAGTVVVFLAGIPITLGAGGGVLAAGLMCGWLRSKHPTFGQIPDGAQWILNDLGLSLFVACVGLTAGRTAFQAMRANGLTIFFSGIAVAVVPILAGVLLGRFVLRMNPILLLGALTGARVIPQAMNALQDDAQSKTLALGFAAPYAFSNVFLTVMGSIIVNLM